MKILRREKVSRQDGPAKRVDIYSTENIASLRRIGRASFRLALLLERHEPPEMISQALDDIVRALDERPEINKIRR